MHFVVPDNKNINLEIATFNAQSLKTGRDKLVRIIEQHNPDIIAITETRLKTTLKTDQYKVTGYFFYKINRAVLKK